MGWGVCAACGTWLANTHMLDNVAIDISDRFDLLTKQDCWDACEADSDCNANSTAFVFRIRNQDWHAEAVI